MESQEPQAKTNQEQNQQPKSNECPICLERIKNLAITIDCQHNFCYDCINEWILRHNKCPVCRRIIKSIHYNIHSNGEMFDSTEVLPPVRHPDLVIPLNPLITFVNSTPNGLYLITPYRTTINNTNNQFFYNIRFLPPGEPTIIWLADPRTLYVLPEDLNPIIRHLEQCGIYRYNGRGNVNNRLHFF